MSYSYNNRFRHVPNELNKVTPKKKYFQTLSLWMFVNVAGVGDTPNQMKNVTLICLFVWFNRQVENNNFSKTLQVYTSCLVFFCGGVYAWVLSSSSVVVLQYETMLISGLSHPPRQMKLAGKASMIMQVKRADDPPAAQHVTLRYLLKGPRILVVLLHVRLRLLHCC